MPASEDWDHAKSNIFMRLKNGEDALQIMDKRSIETIQQFAKFETTMLTTMAEQRGYIGGLAEKMEGWQTRSEAVLEKAMQSKLEWFGLKIKADVNDSIGELKKELSSKFDKQDGKISGVKDRVETLEKVQAGISIKLSPAYRIIGGIIALLAIAAVLAAKAF